MDGGFTAHIVLKFKHDILHLFPLVSYIQNLMFSQGNCLLFKHTNILLNFTTKNTHQCRTNAINIQGVSGGMCQTSGECFLC
jgi:hypothetical protein